MLNIVMGWGGGPFKLELHTSSNDKVLIPIEKTDSHFPEKDCWSI